MVKNVKTKILYLPSTPLNILVSIAHAVHFSSKQSAQLILIDQKTMEKNIYFHVLKTWLNSPFLKVDIILGLEKGSRKIQERKKNFLKLSNLLNAFPAEIIAVGSDRRIEFQYLMNLRVKSLKTVEGWYLDDGLYSYAGRPYKWFKDKVNSLLKKLAYGLWWQEPSTIGASAWIKQVWLFRPQNAVITLQAKQVNELEADWFVSPEIKEFSTEICTKFGLEKESLEELKRVGVFLLVPHPNNIKKMVGYEQRVHQFLAKLHRQGIRVAIKYHPRTEELDLLGLKEKYQALIIPSGLAFEFILPFLKESTKVVGDVGTALLTAQWLRTDLNVYAVLAKHDAFQNSFREIYSQLGVRIISDFELI